MEAELCTPVHTWFGPFLKFSCSLGPLVASHPDFDLSNMFVYQHWIFSAGVSIHIFCPLKNVVSGDFPHSNLKGSLHSLCVRACVRACMCVCVFATSPGKNTGNILQAILQAKFSRQEYWSGLPSPPPGHLPDPGIKALSPGYPALSGGFFTISTTWEGLLTHWKGIKYLMRRNYERLKKC